MEAIEKRLEQRKLSTLVENQTSYALQHAEMHVFETHQQAAQVALTFEAPVLAYMLEGKKVMHLQQKNAFDFLPGESLLLPPKEAMCIDFPEAKLDCPTRCLALAISEEKIKETVNFLNEHRSKADNEWEFVNYNFHFTNNIAIQQIVYRLLYLFTENHASKDMFADFMLQELLVRILQAENQKIYTEQAFALGSNHRLAYIVNYIRKNLNKELSIKELSDKVYMSESNFHRVFKNELNSSPINFINNERIKLAKSLLQNPHKKIKDVYWECGFKSLSYFIRLFKRQEQFSPKEYQLKIKQQKGFLC